MSLKILHIIETLSRGGAELLFIKYIEALPANVENYVVYLRRPDTLLPQIQNVKQITCLNHENKWSLPRSVFRLSALIKRWEVDIVHSHLYWPTIVARLATPDNVKLVYSLHNLISFDAFAPNRLSKYLEKLTYTPRYYAVGVSHSVLKDYSRHIRLSGRSSVIYNFIDGAFFQNANTKAFFDGSGLKLVSVGNLRRQKNYSQLINTMAQLKEYDISLDIIGDGPEYEHLQQLILENQLEERVCLRGARTDVATLLNSYDVFVSTTLYEGFYIAMAEAMAVGLPCVVPNLDVLKEVSGDAQLYYTHPSGLAEKLRYLYHNKQELTYYSEKAKAIAKNYTIEKHIAELVEVYRTINESS